MPYSTAFSVLQAPSETQTPVLSQDTRDVLELMPGVDRVTICMANVTKIVVRTCRALVSLANQGICFTTIAHDGRVNLQGLLLLLFLLFAILHLLLHLGRCPEVPVQKSDAGARRRHMCQSPTWPHYKQKTYETSTHIWIELEKAVDETIPTDCCQGPNKKSLFCPSKLQNIAKYCKSSK